MIFSAKSIDGTAKDGKYYLTALDKGN